jgi:ethanolamine utilization protein EutJ
LFPIIRPVLEKVGAIVARHIAAQAVDTIYLIGGTACLSGIRPVIEEVAGLTTRVPNRPLFITPLGVAMHDRPKMIGNSDVQ